MTRLTYDIMRNGTVVKNVVSYQQALDLVAELGNGYTYKAVYTPFDPDDTPERRKTMREMREKFWKKRIEKMALRD